MRLEPKKIPFGCRFLHIDPLAASKSSQLKFQTHKAVYKHSFCCIRPIVRRCLEADLKCWHNRSMVVCRKCAGECLNVECVWNKSQPFQLQPNVCMVRLALVRSHKCLYVTYIHRHRKKNVCLLLRVTLNKFKTHNLSISIFVCI